MTTVTPALLTLLLVAIAADAHAAEPEIYFQAHRGGLLEVPENTLAAYRHAWSCPGAIPEMDVCVAQDGTMVCMHDDTPARTTTAPEPYAKQRMAEIPVDEIRRWDAGVKFDSKYAGEKVPLLTEVLQEMKDRPERQAYLDIKDVDLAKLADLIRESHLERQIIFVHGEPAMCVKLQGLFSGARTMTWLSGSPERIKQGFEQMAANGFKGISQLQFHLRSAKTKPEIGYVLDDDFLRHAVAVTQAAGVDLQLRPFDFNASSLRRLIDLGIRWYVADAPRRFADCLRDAAAMPPAAGLPPHGSSR